MATDETQGVIAQHEQRLANDEEYRKSALTPPGGSPPSEKKDKDDAKAVKDAREGKFAD